jgi:cobalamin-dependent methionine synthase I
MSGLLVKSTAFMKDNLQAFNTAGISVPVILGGAALPGVGAAGAAKGAVTGARTAINVARAGAAAGAAGALGNSEADLTQGGTKPN